VIPRNEIVRLDKRHVWHPYTAMGRYLAETDPIVVVGAEGARLIEANGRTLIDANSSWWCAALGHQHPRLVAALCEQAQSLCHVAFGGITHEPSARLAAELSAAAPPGLERVFFSDDGSTAIEAALKLAVQYWAQNGRPERRRLLALSGAFHGETLGSAMASDIEVFQGSYAGLAVSCLRAPAGADGHARAVDALVELVTKHESELAAVLLEPVVQGAAGMRIYDPALVRVAREVTARHDVLLILDEVFTGYGRTGPMWAAELAGVAPDLLCVAKGFTAGMLPMAATLASARVFEGFLGDPSRAFFHGHTFAGNPLGARVALEVLAVYRDEAVLERARPKAARIASAFRALGELPGVSGARSLGMVGALELGAPGYLEPRGQLVYQHALARGAYLRPLGNTVYIAPPINIPDPDLDELLGIVEESLRVVLGAACRPC
jgi:adenosylmethionine-8-amino-7-oxononanoate aminotransferase